MTIARWQEKNLLSMMKVWRGVNLTGARQVGKSTLADLLALPSARRYSFDDPMIRNAAKDDPIGFVKHGEGEALIIDEIQKVPELLEAIKLTVDKDNSPGQYLLTGSSNLRFAKKVKDSLAGRLGRIRLRSLTFAEINGGGPNFLEKAFAGKLASKYPELTKREVIHLAFRGGYPETLDYSPSDRIDWFKTYLDDLLEKDIKDVTEIRKLEKLQAIALWLLIHSAQFFSIEELASKVSVAKNTVQNYMEALKALYLFDSVPAWAKSDYDRLGKREKWFASDSGLIANILGWNEEEVYLDEKRNGKLIESWVYQQLASMTETLGGYTVSHYRDNQKREIDFVVERNDGAILGIEVKAGQASLDDFKALKWFAKNLAKKTFTGIVLYSGSQTLRFGEGFYAVPFSALG